MFTPSVTLKFNEDTKRFRIEDVTVLNGLNLSLISVTGRGTVYDVSGEVIATNITINKSAGATASAWVNLPVDANGDVVVGTYRLAYEYNFVCNALPIDGITTTSQMVCSEMDLSNVLVNGSIVTVASATNAGNNGAKTVTAVGYASPNTTITVSNTLVVETPSPATISFNVISSGYVNNVYTYKGCPRAVPSVNVFYDCDSTQFGTITFSDTTVLPSGQERTGRNLTVSFPNGLTNPVTPAPQSTGLNSLTIDTLATGTWVYSLDYNVRFTQADGLIVDYTASTGAIEEKVSCKGSLCSLAKCMGVILQKHQEALKNTGNSPYWLVVSSIGVAYAQAESYRTCGKYDKMREVLKSLSELIENSGCDCGCCDEEGNAWVDNSTFSGENALAVLQEQIDAINLTVIPLIDQLANDTDALAAYNTILGELVDYNAGVNTLVAAMGIFQSQLNAINPASASFQEQLDALIATVEQFEATSLPAAVELGDEIEALIQAFQTSYPTYDAYTDALLDTLLNIQGQLGVVDTNVNTFLTALNSLTPVNYASQITGLQGQVATLTSQMGAAFSWLSNLTTNASSIATGLQDLANQVAANTIAIQALQNQGLTSYCKPIKQVFNLTVSNQASLNSAGLNNIAIPAEFFTDGAYIKIRCRAKSDNVFTMVLQNLNDQFVGGNLGQPVAVTGSMGDIEVFIRKIAGTNNFAGLTSIVSYGGNGPTEVTHLEQDFALTTGQLQVNTNQAIKIVLTQGTGTISVLEVTGYKSI